MQTSESIKEISGALLKAQSAMGALIKDADNPFHKSKYATINAVLDACKKPLLDNGLIVMQGTCEAPEYLKGSLCLNTRIIHAESGEWIESTITMPLQKNDPQGMGSAITYARRYALQAMLGLAAEDDDAEAAMQRNAPPQRGQHQPQRQSSPPRRPNQNGGQAQPEADMPAFLPRIRGLSYNAATLDGVPVFVTVGNTFNVKDQLKKAGFRYNKDLGGWYIEAQNSLQDSPDYEPDYEGSQAEPLDEVPF